MTRVSLVLLSLAILLVSCVDQSAAADFDPEEKWACIKDTRVHHEWGQPPHLCASDQYCQCNDRGSPQTNPRFGQDCQCLSTDYIVPYHSTSRPNIHPGQRPGQRPDQRPDQRPTGQRPNGLLGMMNNFFTTFLN